MLLWLSLLLLLILLAGGVLWWLFVHGGGFAKSGSALTFDQDLTQVDLLHELRRSLMDRAHTPPAATVLHQYLSFVGDQALRQDWVRWEVPAACEQGRQFFVTARFTKDLAEYIRADIAAGQTDQPVAQIDLSTHMALLLESGLPGAFKISAMESLGDNAWRWGVLPRRAGRQRVRLIVGCTIEWYQRFLQETYVTEAVTQVQGRWLGKVKALFQR